MIKDKGFKLTLVGIMLLLVMTSILVYYKGYEDGKKESTICVDPIRHIFSGMNIDGNITIIGDETIIQNNNISGRIIITGDDTNIYKNKFTTHKNSSAIKLINIEDGEDRVMFSNNIINVKKKTREHKMRTVKTTEDNNDSVNLKDIDQKYIYAGLDIEGKICIANKVRNKDNYVMQVFSISENAIKGFTSGNCYSYNDGLYFKPLLKKFSECHNTDVYEFRTIKEFLEWALEVENRRK